MKRIGVSGALLLVLSGCGGGGGAVNSTPPPPVVGPAPTPAPAPATNSNIGDLRVSQSFANDAVTTDVTFNLVSNTTGTSRAATTPLTISFDAPTGNYLVTGRVAETFSPADRQQGTLPGETRFVRRTGDESTFLTLVTTPYFGSTPNQFVALGYLQRNSVANERQETAFTAFAFGLDTPAGGVPRTGRGAFATDVFGLETVPGREPVVFQGRGRFDVDFISGLFSTQTSLQLRALLTGSGVAGGGIELIGGGRLSASNGTFSGDVVYGGRETRLGGTLSGRFFGPNAQEIGASFSGSASDGSAFSGALTGQRDAQLGPVNISFDRLVTQQRFFADSTTLSVRTPRNGSAPSVSTQPGLLGSAVSRSSLEDRTGGNVAFGPPTSNMAGGDYTTTSIVAGDPNFVTYARTIAGQPTRLELYRRGDDNRELALTYASFGRYMTSRNDDPFATEMDRVFFVYGFNTPSGLFANRTGTASYAGVAYGAAADRTGAFFDVTGRSQMTVDFGAMSLSGSLSLLGAGTTGSVDYGTFGFNGRLFSNGSTATAALSRPAGAQLGTMLVNFYGPSASEAGGLFDIRVADGPGANHVITGAMVARRQ